MIDELTRTLLERYIDGDVTEAERQAFELRLSREPHLREALAQQRRIDASIRRQFLAPVTSTQSIMALVEATSSTHDDAPQHVDAGEASAVPEQAALQMNPWLRRLAVAAVLAAGLFGVWQTWNYLKPIDDRTVAAAPRLLTAAQYYSQKVQNGFEPLWLCDNDEQFAHTFRYRFGQSLLLKPPERQDVRMVGLDYTQVLSPSTVSMLGEVNGQHVVVIVDRIAADNPNQIRPGCGSSSLNTFRREIGELVAYEVTPLEEPQFLNLLYQPQK